MKGLRVALWMEVLKVRKSRVFPGTILFFAFVACMMGLVMFVQKHPETAEKIGLMGDKASMMRYGEPGWESFFQLLIQGYAGIGLVGLGFITTWVFAREYVERTLKDLFVTPVSRSAIICAKSIVILVWSLLLALTFLVMSMVIGWAIGLPGFSSAFVLQYGSAFAMTALLSLVLFSPTAFLASYSGGYIFPLGFVVLTLIAANFSGLIGIGPYFPWAVPGLCGVSSPLPGMQVHGVSFVLLFGTGILGLYGTIWYWGHADHQ